MIRRPPRSPLFPSPPLFRSSPPSRPRRSWPRLPTPRPARPRRAWRGEDRKSTRLNSSHGYISYSGFFFNDPAPPEISPLSLPAALPFFAAVTSAPILAAPPHATPGEASPGVAWGRSEEHTSELQSRLHLLFRLFF